MKSILLPLALIPILLTGCTTSGYYSDYPGYAYPAGYYDGPYYGYGPTIGFGYYDGGYYRHDYHHYAGNYHHGYSGHGSFHNTRVASVSHNTHVSGHTATSHTASVSSGTFHTGGSHTGGHGHH